MRKIRAGFIPKNGKGKGMRMTRVSSIPNRAGEWDEDEEDQSWLHPKKKAGEGKGMRMNQLHPALGWRVKSLEAGAEERTDVALGKCWKNGNGVKRSFVLHMVSSQPFSSSSNTPPWEQLGSIPSFCRSQHVRGCRELHQDPIPGSQHAEGREGDLQPHDLCHRHAERQVRLRRRHRRDHQREPQGLRPLLSTSRYGREAGARK